MASIFKLHQPAKTMWKQIVTEVLLVLLLTYCSVDAQDPTHVLKAVAPDEDGKACLSIDQLENVRNELKHKINDVIMDILTPGSLKFPASSCADIPSNYPSGYYWIKSDDTLNATQQYCDTNRTCSCSSKKQWMRAANLDMTNPNEQCPSGLRLVTFSGLRTCGRPDSIRGCASVTYPVHGVEYSRVCGRIIGYQFGNPDAFGTYNAYRNFTIDDHYLDGVSLTHGSSPRKHIWSFAAAVDEARFTSSVCPCNNPDNPFPGTIPPFIGHDYFCETGSRDSFKHNIYFDKDPLWNGQGCGPTSTCCSFNTPPWFCKELPQSTTDDIELRLCAQEHISSEDTPLEIVEIYVQ